MKTTLEDGKLVIPEDLREKFGEKYHIIEKGDKIILLPVSDNPLEALREEFGDVDKHVDQLKEEALETAMEDSGKGRM